MSWPDSGPNVVGGSSLTLWAARRGPVLEGGERVQGEHSGAGRTHAPGPVYSVGWRGGPEQLDEHDHTVITRLGYGVARAQLFEFAMVKLLEAQRQDMAIPLDERWPEIRTWLKASAGRTSGKLDVPEPIRKDLLAVVECRNVVAHHAYRTYLTARENRRQSCR